MASKTIQAVISGVQVRVGREDYQLLRTLRRHNAGVERLGYSVPMVDRLVRMRLLRRTAVVAAPAQVYVLSDLAEAFLADVATRESAAPIHASRRAARRLGQQQRAAIGVAS